MTYSEKTEQAINAEAARAAAAKAAEPELPGVPEAASKVVDMDESAGGEQDIGGVSGKRLRAYLDRIDRLEDERKGLTDDIKDIYQEAKGVGFCAKTIRKLVRLRKQDVEKRREEHELMELYKAAVGLE